mgnify:CR=1 FL=1
MTIGDIRLGETLDIKFTTIDGLGAPTALVNGVAAAYPGNSTTEITAGITLTANFDAITGLNNLRVVATSANGYVAGENYVLVLTAGTVDAVSVVGYIVNHFSIENRTIKSNIKYVNDVAVTGDGSATSWGPA